MSNDQTNPEETQDLTPESEAPAQEAPAETAADAVVDTAGDAPADSPAAEPAGVQPPDEPTPESAPAPVAKTPEPPAQPAAVEITTAEEFIRQQNRGLRQLHRVTSEVIARMEMYCDAMDRTKAMNQNDAAVHQRNLYLTFLTALSAPDEAVKQSMDAIAWYFMKNRKNCFAPSHALRAINMMRVTSDQSQSFQYMMHCFMTLSDPSTRKQAVKQVDIGRASSKLETLQQRENFIAYFTQ